jgi:hypothetical protein
MCNGERLSDFDLVWQIVQTISQVLQRTLLYSYKEMDRKKYATQDLHAAVLDKEIR